MRTLRKVLGRAAGGASARGGPRGERNVLGRAGDGVFVGGGHRVERALARQSLLIAIVCVLVDGVSVAVLGAPLGPLLWVALIVLLLADAALALPVRLSGWVALAHAVAGILITAATWITVNRHGTGGGPVLIRDSQVGALIAGYRAGAWLRRWPSVLSLGVLVASVVGSRWFGRDTHVLNLAIAATASAVLPWLVGRYTTSRRAYIDELRHRRENERRAAQAAVEAAVARERSVIARDLHDVISHHVSAIGMHAGAARLGLAARGAGDPVAGSLSAVEVASRAAMVDLRKLLDVLHGTAEGAEQPGLANLEELVTGVRPVGPPVRLTVHGGSRALPESLDVALYRVAQEMLTNALRHGDGTAVDIEIRYADGTVTLATRNGIGPGAPTTRLAGTGRGLAGIRTRAAMFDGSVRYGPDDTGRRWETTVIVPTAETSVRKAAS